jgi:hypothetical protein
MCVFRSNRLITYYILSIRQILERENGNTTKQRNSSLIDFKKAYDSVRKVVLYNILTEFGIPLKW